jgi:probable phosphoglycerate mutase
MTDIILIRHGETDWNRVRRLQGHWDIALNELGHRQASALARALSSEKPTAIYASDLQRARDTAQAVADRHQITVSIDARLRERCYGAFEGLLYDDIDGHFPQAFAQWQARELHARFPAGERQAETLHEFSARAVAVVTELAQRHDNEKIIIVSHGGVLDCVYRAAYGMDLLVERQFDMKNAAINRLHWNGTQMTVLQWADVAHLDAAALDEI